MTRSGNVLLFLIAVLFVTAPVDASAQTTGIAQPDRSGTIYNQEFSIGGRFNTNGWGLFAERGKIQNIYRTRIFQAEFVNITHPKQVKQPPLDIYSISPYFDTNKSYFFGKQNSYYALQLGIGYRRNLADRANRNGVQVSLTYLGGVSLGLLKPYYLRYIDSIYQVDNRTHFVIVSDKYKPGVNDDDFLEVLSITGYSGFKYGIKEIVPIPGIYGKFGINFDWASNPEIVKSLEAGISLQVYYRTIPIMILEQNKPYFVSLYLSGQFGKRWYK